jgi:hypothetical protein
MTAAVCLRQRLLVKDDLQVRESDCDCRGSAIVFWFLSLLMGLLRTLFWLGLFLVSTFAFTVLFEHGATDFAANSEKEWTAFKEYAQKLVDGAPKGESKK